MSASGRKRAVGAGLFAIALALRVYGLCWAAPLRYDLHPDEMEHVMGHALAISFSDPDPKFLNYPSFLIYLIALTNGLFTRLGLVTETWQSYVLARALVATFGALTAPAAFALALELGGSTLSAGLAGLCVALLPLHVWESHFAVTDVVMTFWILVALVLSVRLLRRTTVRDLAVVGAVIGLAVASKYTAAMVVLSPLAALLLAPPPLATALVGLGALGFAALTACFLGTPFSFLHFHDLQAAMAYEYEHVHSLHYGFSLPAAGWQYHKYVYELFASFPFSYGFALYAAAAAGTAWVLVTLRRESSVVLVFAAVFFGVVGHWTFTPLRYMLPVVVIGACFAGLWMGAWIEDGAAWKRVTGGAAAIVVIGYTALFTFSTTERFRHDTRVEAGEWLDQALAPDRRLLICGFSPYFALPDDPRLRVVSANEAWITRLHERTDFDLVEISALHYWRYQRHHHPAFEPAYHRFRAGELGFKLVKRFEGDFLNRDLYEALDPMFAGYFVSPTLEFYERSDAPHPIEASAASGGSPGE